METTASIRPFGTLESGEEVREITLKNETLSCQILTFGATLRTLSVPDRRGEMVDVVLGYDTLEEYMARDGYLGATVGRCANRIAKGRFSLNGKDYLLFCNDGNNHLHGGKLGFSHRVWDIGAVTDTAATLTLRSEDGEEVYGGNMTVSVTYELKGTGLYLHYEGQSDQDTLCSLTNHSYFNLGGHDSGDVLKQKIAIYAETYTPSDAESIPTGDIDPVAGTPMDLRTPTPIGAHIEEDFWQLRQAKGYDHNFAVNDTIGTMKKVAEVVCEESGISMAVSTTLPGMHFYTANYIEEAGRRGKDGAIYYPLNGFCLETQQYPDAIHHPNFPSAVLKAGEKYDHTTSFVFSTLS